MGWREPEDYAEPTDYGMELDSQEARKERLEWQQKELQRATQERRYQRQKDATLREIKEILTDYYAGVGNQTAYDIITEIDMVIEKALTYPDPSV